MTENIRSILVPIDGTPESEASLPVATKLAQGLGAEIVLLHVTELPETDVQESDALSAAHKALAEASEKVPVTVRLRVDESGDPVRGILQASAEEHSDMVVMATHGRGKLAALTEGSVAYDVIKSGTLPVTLVNMPEDKR